jgi:hypothetical protein
MIGPNLSEWAVKRRPLIVYLMIAAVVAGSLSFFRLGRNEDPAFAIRTMVVQAAWPGATLEDTVLQVTERIERRLQEVPGLDYLTSYTRPGITTIFVNLRGDVPGRDVPDRWYDVRKKVGDIRHTLPNEVLGPFFNDEFGDVFGIIYGFTADGFTHRELRDYVEAIRSRLLLVPDVSKIEIVGAQDEQVFLEFSSQRLAALGLDYRPWSQRSRRRMRCAPLASCRPATSGLRSGFRARSIPSSTFWRSTSSSATAWSAWVTSPRSGAAMSTRRSRCSASTATPRSASASRCATAATFWRSAATSPRR